MAKKQAEAVYKIVEVVGVSETSWEEAGRNAVETAAGSLRDLRVAEVTKMDMRLEEGRSPRFARGYRSPSYTKHDVADRVGRGMLRPMIHSNWCSSCRSTPTRT